MAQANRQKYRMKNQFVTHHKATFDKEKCKPPPKDSIFIKKHALLKK
jgi:hypothetical protein